MILRRVWIQKYRNILDSTEIEIDPDVTCLVGKNESGKTAVLEALHGLNPARGDRHFSIPDHYPAWIEKRDRLEGVDREKTRPICAQFELTEQELGEFADAFGPDVLTERTLEASRTYDGELVLDIGLSRKRAVEHLVAQSGLCCSHRSAFGGVEDVQELREKLAEAKAALNSDEQDASSCLANLDQLSKRINEVFGGGDLTSACQAFMKERLPQFFYFSEYSKLPYAADVRRVLKTATGELSEGEMTARALLRLGAADDDYLLASDYERRKRELENVANYITEEVNEFWSQNQELRVEPDITLKQEGPNAVIDQLRIRIWDNRHSLSLPFDEHSAGFQWFFSFLAGFSEYRRQERAVIILLDEPALNLHAMAQHDFLRFIDERLAGSHQVVYTTHSPFMVEPGKLARVRVVEDRGKAEGAKISKEVLSTDKATLFPLQSALGYEIAQNLFVSPNNLVVEGTSDYAYLRVMSDHLNAQEGRVGLDKRWTIVPVGGADLIPTFVALLGHHLGMTVLIDARTSDHQRLTRLARAGYVDHDRIVAIGEVVGHDSADIEDVFQPEDYLLLFNRAFAENVRAEELVGTDRIVDKLCRHCGWDDFDHGKPADVLLRERDTLLSKMSAETMDAFEDLFARINRTLEASAP